MPEPTMTQTLKVNVNYDATKKVITSFSGDCDANGNIKVNATTNVVNWVNIIEFSIVTTDPQIPAAVMQNLVIALDPTWLTSTPEPAGQDPAWILEAQGGAVRDLALYTVFVGLPGETPFRKDPTIINVDPPAIVDLLPAAEPRSAAAAAG
jgi:hypothetical protein